MNWIQRLGIASQRPIYKRNVSRSFEKYLEDSGWTVDTQIGPPLNRFIDLIATKSDTRIGACFGGSDSCIKHTQINDLYRWSYTGKFTPIAVYAGVLMPAVRVAAETNRVIIISTDEMDSFETLLERAPARVLGQVDFIYIKGLVGGWAKLVPTRQRARVVVSLGDRLIGEGVADRFRPDLQSRGDGKFGFEIRIPEIQDVEYTQATLKVTAYEGSMFVGYLARYAYILKNS